MLRLALSLSFVIATATTAAADVPAEGLLAAVQSDSRETTTIYRLKPTGVEKVGTHSSAMLSEAGWSDATTLWVMSNSA